MNQNLLDPIFLIGVPQSGTNLLGNTLDTHPEIAGAHDTAWLTSDHGNTNFSIRGLVDNLINNEINAITTLTGITPDVVKAGAREFISTVLSEYLTKRGKKHLVLDISDDAAHLDFLLDLFPGSKYIHIFRDGRDVACSLLAQKDKISQKNLTGFGELNLFNVLKRWNNLEIDIRSLLQGRDSISISYEALVQEPATTTQKLVTFLQVPYEEGMIEQSIHDHENQELEAGSDVVLSNKELQDSGIGAWKTDIPSENWPEIDHLYGSFLEDLGYKRCREVAREDSQLLQSLPQEDYNELMDKFENEILALRQTIYEKNEQLNKQVKNLAETNELLVRKNDRIESQEESIQELTHKIDITLPSLMSQLQERSKTIEHLQNILQNQDELLTRIISGRSFRLGRLLTSPSRIIGNKPSGEDELEPIRRRKKRFVDMGDQLKAGYGSHRSGWAYAVACLAPINRPDRIFLDTFIERTFVWKPGEVTPTLKPWIGFIHVPPNVPDWFQSEQSNEAIFQTRAWQESFPFCKGLFTLSEYHKNNLEKKLDVPINNLLHPTEFPARKWQYEKFVLNPKRKIVQIGWWLRKLHAIYELPSSDYEKVFLRVSDDDYFHEIFRKEFLLRKESGHFQNSMYDTVKTIEYLPNNEYDRLLSENIVFADLYDSSANNLVIECIARNTPLLINPLEPVMEYLGEDYPFYFSSYEEAVAKAQDLDLVEKTYNFLKEHKIKRKITGEYFLQSFLNSEIMNNCQ